MNLHHLVSYEKQKSQKNVRRKSCSLKKKICGLHFTRMKLGDIPLKIHQDLESVYGISCSYDTVCRWIRRFQSGKKDLSDEPRSGAPKTAMNDNAIELIMHAIPDGPHLSVWKRCVQSGHTTSWQGHKKRREWDVLNRCLLCLTAGAHTTDWCCHRRWNFHKLLWHALKTGKYDVDRWSQGQTSRPQTKLSEQEAALHYIF